MRRQALVFTAPGQLSIIDEEIAPPVDDQLMVETTVSAISTGTELLVYRGQLPDGLAADETIAALTGPLGYPLRYGYAAIGRVTAVGPAVERDWLGRQVFAFQPHASHFVARATELVPIAGAPEAAACLPNLETAVNLLLDSRPLIGEHVVVVGQGVVGLLVTALLTRLPLASLTAIERLPMRRARARAWGAQAIDPADAVALGALRRRLATTPAGGADLVIELSGNPAALDLAIGLTGYSGRLVVGSWYGAKRDTIDLGGWFHRSKISIIASQVSRIAPELTGRWTTARRLQLAADLLPDIPTADLITARVPLDEAASAYQLLDLEPDRHLLTVLQYGR